MRVMRAVLYTRASSDDQTKGYSLADQFRELRDHATDQGLEVIEEVSDHAFSRAISSVARKRARLQEMGVDLIVFSELEERLRDLDQIRKVTEERLSALESRLGRLEELERRAHDFVSHYSSLVGGAIETATSEKRRRIYEALGANARAITSGEAEVDLPIFEGADGEIPSGEGTSVR